MKNNEIRTNNTNNENKGGIIMMNGTIENVKAFAEVVRDLVVERMGATAIAEVQEVVKNNNQRLTGITVRTKEINVSPTIYLDDFYSRYLEGESITGIVDHIIRIYEENKADRNLDISFIDDFERAKNRICFKLVNACQNTDLLSNAPHRIVFDDLAVVYFMTVDQRPIGRGTVTIKNELMKNWNTEFRGLCETAIRYFPGDVAHGYVQYIREHFSNPNLWDKSELRAMRHEVIRAAQVYWTKQAEYQMRLVAYYDLTEVIFKKPARFIGDTAFKIVVRFYYGDNENWITPCKDLIVDTIDEAVWSYAETGQADWNLTENLLAQCTNTIENYISIADSKGAGLTFSTGGKDTQQLAFALCGFMLADMIQNYYKMDPKDFFECVRQSFIDLSSMALRKIAGAGLLKAANSQWVQKFFKLSWVKAVTDYLKKNIVQEVARGNATIIDPKTGLAKVQQTRITGNVDAKIADGRNFVHFGEAGEQADAFGKMHMTLNAGDLELQHTLLGGPGQDVDVQLVNFDGLESATYRDMVQNVLDGLFGLGIATLMENLDDDPESKDYGTVSFPIYTKNGKKTYAVINLCKLFTSPAGLSSYAFVMVYETLFGSFSVPSGQSGFKDVGRAVLGFSDIHPT